MGLFGNLAPSRMQAVPVQAAEPQHTLPQRLLFPLNPQSHSRDDLGKSYCKFKMRPRRSPGPKALVAFLLGLLK